MLDLVLEGGEVVDGLGGGPVRADVGIEGGRVTAVGDLGAEPAVRRVDATGRQILPGFVDIHSHSELSLLSDGRGRSKVRQGVTTEIVGNCGIGVFPTGPDAAQSRAAAVVIDDDPDVAWPAPDLTAYRAALAAARPALNVAILAGHSPLRIAAAPDQPGPLDAAQIQRMTELLDEAFDQGPSDSRPA